MPINTTEGHGSLEALAGRTTSGQGVGYDPSAFDLFGYDPAMDQRRAAQGRLGEAQDAAARAQAELTQWEAAERGYMKDWYEKDMAQMASDPRIQEAYARGDTSWAKDAFSSMSLDKMRKYEELKKAVEEANAGAKAAQGTFEEEMAGIGPSKFDTEQQRLLDASQGKSFEEASGPYLDALAKARGELEGATGLYGAAARGEGPSAAQSQFQSALDQSNRMAMARAGSMRGGALNQISAQRDAAMQAGQSEAEAASKSASLRAQEMQAAMQGYAQSAGMLGAQDQRTIGLQQQHQGQMQQQQRFYEQLRHQGFSEQAAMKQAQQQMDVANEWNQRRWEKEISDAQRDRSNAGWQTALGVAQGVGQAAAQVGGAMMTGGASLGAQAAMSGLSALDAQQGLNAIDQHAASGGGVATPSMAGSAARHGFGGGDGSPNYL